MALRVLLADESATIKKVIELSLQDFAVELKTVNIGSDVMKVAQSFQPDILFLDVLLQKKNGYEVCNEIKSHPETLNIPVVLLWSGFMDVDPEKMNQVKADAKLEKPFDSETLRDTVQKLVGKTQEPLFGDNIELPDTPAVEVKSPEPPSQAVTENWNMDSFDKIESLGIPDIPEAEEEEAFSQMPIGDISEIVPKEKFQEQVQESAPEPVSDTLITHFQVDIPEEELEDLGFGDFQSETHEEENFDASDFLWSPEDSKPKESTEESSAHVQPPSPEATAVEAQSIPTLETEPAEAFVKQTIENVPEKPQINDQEVQELIRKEAVKIIHEMALKMVPNIAEEIIQKEIQRLTQESEL